MFFYTLCWVLAFLPIRIFFPTKIIGRKNLPKKKKAILTCNHRSNSDIVVIDGYMHRRPYTLAKHTLFEKKFKGAVLKSYGAIPVNRESVGLSTVKTVLNVLKKDKWLLIFPEGTRKDISDDEQMSLKNGTAMFALKSGAPIVPMWLIKKPKVFSRNVLLIGEPFSVEQFAGQKITSEVLGEVSKIISQKMQELRDDYLKQQQEKKEKKLAKKLAKQKSK